MLEVFARRAAEFVDSQRLFNTFAERLFWFAFLGGTAIVIVIIIMINVIFGHDIKITAHAAGGPQFASVGHVVASGRHETAFDRHLTSCFGAKGHVLTFLLVELFACLFALFFCQ